MKFAIFLLIIPIVVTLIVALPTITINTGAVITSSAYSYIRAACYFLPLNTVSIILGLIVSIWVFRIVVAIIKAIWDLLPVA